MAWTQGESYTCRTCGTETNEAYVLPSKPDRRQTECKACDAARRAVRKGREGAGALILLGRAA